MRAEVAAFGPRVLLDEAERRAGSGKRPLTPGNLKFKDDNRKEVKSWPSNP